MTHFNVDQVLRPYTLNRPHVQDLADSGITPEAAKAAGITSVPPNFVSKILGLCGFGWAADNVESILAFSYRSLNGDETTSYRFKIIPPFFTRDGRAAKYLQPQGTVNRVYVPPGVEPQGKDTLHITEGEKKAYCPTLHGFSCIALSGVYGFRAKNRDGSSSVIKDFDAINWRKRDAVIVFDADIAINEDVQRAEAELAQELISRKARVFVVRLPYGLGCPKGVDDYIRKHGKEAFAKLRRKPVAPRKGKNRAQNSRAETDPASPFVGTPYLIEKGRLCYVKQVGSGHNVTTLVTPLCNFVAQCQEEIVRDDGRESSREFLITGTLDTGQPLPSATVRAAEFRGMGWINRHWGMAANIVAGQSAQDRVREAIQHLSRTARQRTIFTHSGWRKIKGVWAFLHGGGAINGPAGIEVDLGHDLNQYCLPAPGGPEAVHASYQLLEVAPPEITFPFQSCTYLSVLADLLKVNITLWPRGPTGSLKSTISALFLSHFGDFTALTLPGQWSSTANALERRSFILKDLPFVIDDYAPQHDFRRASEMEAKAHRIIRAVGNRGGRQRLTGEMVERLTYDPHCLIISTGEITPTGQSLAARYFTVEMEQDKVDLIKLTEAQRVKHLYPQAMSAYLHYLAPRLDDTLEMARSLWEGYRDTAQSGAHLRVPEMVAWLMLGFHFFLRFQADMGMISDTYDLEKQAWQVFTNLAEVHGRLIEGERPTLRFLSILRELFIQKRVYVKNTDDGCPQGWEELGWQNYEAPTATGEHIGWAGDSYLYLMPESTFKVVQKAIRDQNGYLGIGKNELLKSLAREGFIEPDDKGENTRSKWIAGRSRRVLYANTKSILG